MPQLSIEIDDWTLQEAAAALDTTTPAETVLRALTVATEVGRGRRLADRQRRLARSDGSRRRRR
jgi:Arc/MetJ family transcription regulator